MQNSYVTKEEITANRFPVSRYHWGKLYVLCTNYLSNSNVCGNDLSQLNNLLSKINAYLQMPSQEARKVTFILDEEEESLLINYSIESIQNTYSDYDEFRKDFATYNAFAAFLCNSSFAIRTATNNHKKYSTGIYDYSDTLSIITTHWLKKLFIFTNEQCSKLGPMCVAAKNIIIDKNKTNYGKFTEPIEPDDDRDTSISSVDDPAANYENKELMSMILRETFKLRKRIDILSVLSTLGMAGTPDEIAVSIIENGFDKTFNHIIAYCGVKQIPDFCFADSSVDYSSFPRKKLAHIISDSKYDTLAKIRKRLNPRNEVLWQHSA